MGDFIDSEAEDHHARTVAGASELKDVLGVIGDTTEAQMKPDFDKAWDMVLEDERLATIRKKLSVHELRQLFYVAVEGLCGPPESTGLPFKKNADPFTD